jgi:hypothetical protein
LYSSLFLEEHSARELVRDVALANADRHPQSRRSLFFEMLARRWHQWLPGKLRGLGKSRQQLSDQFIL